jgi:excinuclease ABC subunit C
MKQETATNGIQELQQKLGLPTTPHVIEAFDISNISGTFAVASMVCAVDGVPRPNRYRRFRIKTVEGSDDPAMIAEAVRRRITALLRENAPPPDLILLDGGITQLRAARSVLQDLGCETIPTAGLAKRYEEIVTDDAPPLRLPEDSSGLKVLRRLRDEAHRFAITYHRKVRGRRIRESVLDEIPGIGPKRKQVLLRKFGSVRQMLNAGEAEIAQVSGIGPVLAKEIYRVLSGA